MDFKEATDILFKGISHADLADEMGVSVAAIRQARLSPDAKAFRRPPPGWEAAVARLVERMLPLPARLLSDIDAVLFEGENRLGFICVAVAAQLKMRRGMAKAERGNV